MIYKDIINNIKDIPKYSEIISIIKKYCDLNNEYNYSQLLQHIADYSVVEISLEGEDKCWEYLQNNNINNFEDAINEWGANDIEHIANYYFVKQHWEYLTYLLDEINNIEIVK